MTFFSKHYLLSIFLFITILFSVLFLIVSSDFPTSEIKYCKDSRTDLCFAWVSSSQNHMTNVPCTEKVESLIKAQK
jgi:hypothetical protein